MMVICSRGKNANPRCNYRKPMGTVVKCSATADCKFKMTDQEYANSITADLAKE